eukprot:scaffold12022_cov52-Phaeocystis_antarctica.AAC.1
MVTLSPPPLGGACDRHLVDLCDLRAPEVAKGLKVTTTACQPSGPQSDNHPCAKKSIIPERTRPLADNRGISMCSDNPDLPKEANKAKCIAVACFVVCAPAA